MQHTILKSLKKNALVSAILAAIGLSSSAYAANYNVTVLNDDGTGDIQNTLSWAILQANTASPEADTITLKTNITITGVMKTLLNSNIIIQSDGIIRTIDGGNQFRPLFVKSGNVTIKNLMLSNGKAKGGDSNDGGGGAGLGGALFMYDGTVLLDNVAFNKNNATGGSSKVFGLGSSGGGMYGNADGNGGGGLFAASTDGYGAYGGTGHYGGDISDFGRGGEDFGSGGGFGGGGGFGPGLVSVGLFTSPGGFGGGGSWGASGGFGGGGGHGFSGGIGGGNGGGTLGSVGNGNGGGGGAGFGGAIFALKGKLTLNDVTFSGNSVSAGTGVNPGTAYAADVFICSGAMDPLCDATVYPTGTTNTNQVVGYLSLNYDVTKPMDDGSGGTPNTLSWAILRANTVSLATDTITLKTDVTITGVMKTLLNSDITLQSDATKRTISGNNKYRPLFVKSGKVTIKNLTLANGKAKGGSSQWGGGGAGLGGALFVYNGSVTVIDVAFDQNNAEGGDSGITGLVSGGGGMFGDGVYRGGGGLFAASTDIRGAYEGTGHYDGGSNSFGGGGDGGFNGGFGGGGGTAGGNGGFGGGGGDGISNSGGQGGFGAGGGYGSTIAGSAGYGAGAGGSNSGDTGGGGAGFGGALFAMKGTTRLVNTTFSGNTVTAGTGTNNGTANARDVFICNSDLHATSPSCSAVVHACGSTSTAKIKGNFGADCPPSLSILNVPVSSRQGNTFTATFEFTEAVTDFTIGDIIISNGSVANFSGSGTTYTVDITANGNGDLSINVPDNAVVGLISPSTPTSINLASTPVVLVPVIQMLLLDD